MKEGPVSPGQVCAGSLAARPLLRTHSGLWQVDRALLGLGLVPSLPGHPHLFTMASRKIARSFGCLLPAEFAVLRLKNSYGSVLAIAGGDQ